MSKTAFDLSKIRGIAFDVDGVLSPSAVPLGDDGIPRRLANTKDGFALREATRKGMKIAIISGAVAPGLRERFAMLGIDDVYLGAGKRLTYSNPGWPNVDLSPKRRHSQATTCLIAPPCGWLDWA